MPINLARFTMEQLIKTGQVTRGYLGIYIQPGSHAPARTARASDTTGVIIGGTAHSSPAAKAGLKAGDVIVAVNGNKVTGNPELRSAIAQLAPGSVARLQIVRGGRTVEVPVTLGQMPRQAPLVRQEG